MTDTPKETDVCPHIEFPALNILTLCYNVHKK